MASNKVVDLRKSESLGTAIFKEHLFLNKKWKVLSQIKPRFSFLLKINLRKMASNKNVDLRKLENFVRSKGKRASFRKPCKNFKIVDEHLT